MIPIDEGGDEPLPPAETPEQPSEPAPDEGAEEPKPPETKKKKKPKVRRAVYVNGDSLAIGTAPYLRRYLPRWKVVHTYDISRHAPQGVAMVHARRAKGALPPVIVVQLGTNDDPRHLSGFRQSVKTVLQAAGKKRCVVWANIVRPPLVGTSYAGYNAILAEFAAKRQNFRVFDWFSMVNANPGLRRPCRVS